MASSSGLALLQRNEAGAKFRTVHQLTYRERLLAKTDPRVAVASASALAACQPPIPREGSSTEQNSDLPEQSRQLKAALTELSTLRSEMAAMQAAVAYLRGEKPLSTMGALRPRTPNKSAINAQAYALKRARLNAQHGQHGSQANKPVPSLAGLQTQPELKSQALQQRLIFEPLSEHQERYAEDGVQPIDREDAVTLTELLDKSLPVGSIQAKISDAWAVRPSAEEDRAMCDCEMLQRDFSLLTTVHSEATKQVASWCTEEAAVLKGLQQRYLELFDGMLSTSADSQRLYATMAAQKKQAQQALSAKGKGMAVVEQRLAKKSDQWEQLHRLHVALQEEFDTYRQTATTDIGNLTYVNQAQTQRLAELSDLLFDNEKTQKEEMASLTRTTSARIAEAKMTMEELQSRCAFLERQLEKAKRRPLRDYPTAEVDVQTDALPEPTPEVIVVEAAPVAVAKAPRKPTKHWMGNFLEFFSTKPMPVGRAHTVTWVLNILGQMWVDKVAQDIADPELNAGKTLCQWIYDWHCHRFGLKKLAEINLADLIKSVQVCWKQSVKVCHFGQLTALVQSRNVTRWVAKEDHEFYQMLLMSVSKACQPASILTLFPLDETTCPTVRVTPAVDAVKAVFKHLDDTEGCKEYFATTFEGLQDTAAGTIPAETLLLSLLEQYQKRVTVNRGTLTALFTAADSTAEGLIDRPQMKAALTCAKPDITDTALTTIWVERQKYAIEEAIRKDAVDLDAFVDAARTHGFGMWKLDCRMFGGMSTLSPTGWRPPTPGGQYHNSAFKRLADLAAACDPPLATQVKQVKQELPSSAKKDGIALEKQLLNFQHLLDEGTDAEAAYLAEQLLVGQLQYLIQMYLPSVLCADPFSAAALKASSRPLTPLVAAPISGGRSPIAANNAAAKWAAALIKPGFTSSNRSSFSGGSGQTPRGLAASAFAAAAARAVGLSKAGADGGLPLLTMGGGLGLNANLALADARGGLSSRDISGQSTYANLMAQSNLGSNSGAVGGVPSGQTTARSSLVNSGRTTPKLLF